MAHGEYATRGSLVDLFPMGSHTPYRIDLFDEEIDSIRTFNPETQRTEDVVDSIELLPAREFPLDEAGIRTFRQNYRAQVEGDLTRSRIYEGVSQGKPPAGIEYYLPLFFEHTATLFDYLPKKTLLVLAEGVDAAVKTFWETVEYRYEQRRHDIERPLLAPEKLFLTAEMLGSWVGDYPRVEVQRFKEADASNPSNLPPRGRDKIPSVSCSLPLEGEGLGMRDSRSTTPSPPCPHS